MPTDLIKLFKRTSETAPQIPGGFVANGDVYKDPDEIQIGPEYSIDEEHLLHGTTFGIVYVDSFGEESTRCITLHSVKDGPEDTTILQCYCHMRHGPRTFRQDRIKTIYDLDGVIYDPDEFFNSLVVTLNNKVQSERAAKPGKQQCEIAINGMRVLIALSAADGFISEKELEVIIDYVAERSFREGLQTNEIERAEIKSYLKRIRPSMESLTKSLAKLEREGASDKRLFIKFAFELANCDGNQTPEEFNILLNIQNRLSV